MFKSRAYVQGYFELFFLFSWRDISDLRCCQNSRLYSKNIARTASQNVRQKFNLMRLIGCEIPGVQSNKDVKPLASSGYDHTECVKAGNLVHLEDESSSENIKHASHAIGRSLFASRCLGSLLVPELGYGPKHI